MVRRFPIHCLVILCFGLTSVASAQEPTVTPAVISLSPVAPAQDFVNPADAGATATRTPTPQAQALLEAKELANVRADASTEADQLGTIRAGEFFNVIGRYARWIQFEYPQSPNGRGWVYDELVTITGDTASIPVIDLDALPTSDPAAAAASQTLIAVTQTPGGVLTATAVARDAVTAPVSSVGGIISTQGVPGEIAVEILPTFTYPPGVVALAPTPIQDDESASVEDRQPGAASSGDIGMPPLTPILILGGIGLLGLAVSSIRR